MKLVHPIKHFPILGALLLGGILTLEFIGCGTFRKQKPTYVTVGDVKVGTVTVEELKKRLMDFADTYASRLAQALLEIEEEASSAEVRKWANKTKIGTTVAAYDIATGRNSIVNLLNMIVMVQLTRIVTEEYWIPQKFPEAADELLPILEQTTEEVWRLADGVMSEEQKEQLLDMIRDWRERNPKQQFVGFIRFDDFAAVQTTSRDPRKQPAGSIFRLFYLDPLANLDPIAREVYYTRLFAERAFFYGQRMPTLFVGQAKSAYYDILATPEFQGVLTDIDTFAAVSERLADSVDGLSEQVAIERAAAFDQAAAIVERERTAAIDQIAARVAGERETILREMESQESQLRDLLAESRGTLTEARETAVAAQGLATAANTAIVSLDKLVSRIHEENRRKESLGDHVRPFDITEYRDTLAQLNEAAREVNTLFNSADQFLDSPPVKGEDSVVAVTLAQARQTGEQLIDRAFRYLLILVVVLLLGFPAMLFVYRFAVHRFIEASKKTG